MRVFHGSSGAGFATGSTNRTVLPTAVGGKGFAVVCLDSAHSSMEPDRSLPATYYRLPTTYHSFVYSVLIR